MDYRQQEKRREMTAEGDVLYQHQQTSIPVLTAARPTSIHLGNWEM